MVKRSSTYTKRYSKYSSPSGLTAGRLHTSGSATVDRNPRSSKVFARKDLKVSPLEQSPYKEWVKIKISPLSDQNSRPPRSQHFSLVGAVRKAFSMSADWTSSSFNAAIVKQIRTESRDTTVEYVGCRVDFCLCPSATKRAFLQKFSPSLMSKTQ